MPQGIKGWAIWIAAQAAVTYAIKLLIKLADNAVMGWGDDRLAEFLGITSPNASTVFSWAVPFALAAVTLWLFHHFTTRPLKAALANQSGGDRFSATGVVGNGLPPRIRIRKLEPYHLIVAGLLIAFGGAVWMYYQRAPQVPQIQHTPQTAATPPSAKVAPVKLLPDDGGPITWYPGQYVFGASGDDKGIRIQSFQAAGQNNSDEFIAPLSGFVRSEITGNSFPLQVNDNGTLVSSEGYGIPAKHQFNIGVRIVANDGGGITSSEFLRDFGRLTFVFKYGNHTYNRRFSPDEIEAEVRRMETDLRPKPVQGVAGVRRIKEDKSIETSANSRYWTPLNAEESTKLRSKLRGIAKELLSIWCNNDNCRDLAETLQDTFKQASWDEPQIQESIFPLNFVGINIAPETEKTKAIANAIEEATAGRIVVRVETEPTNDKMINITFGRKR
jgi:hypothetical protein